MNYKELDKYVGSSLSVYGKEVERRDYYKLEKKYKNSTGNIKFDGYGQRNGLMYLVDSGEDTYIDVHIYNEDIPRLKLVFRLNDDEIIKLTLEDNFANYIKAFLVLVKEYFYFSERCAKFSSGIIPQDLVRVDKIDQILSKSI